MDQLDNIQNLIYVIRGQRVMLDFDLARLYEVETRSLNQTVKRNARRFPQDFMFQLTEQEWILISSQFVTTSRMKRPKKSLPYAFTELGALMLSSVLRSPVADETSIKITRAFVAMRQILSFSTLPERIVTLKPFVPKSTTSLLTRTTSMRVPVRSSMPSARHWLNCKPRIPKKRNHVALSDLYNLKTTKNQNSNNYGIQNQSKHRYEQESDRVSRWDRYLGMTAAMTQVPVPTATNWRLCFPLL